MRITILLLVFAFAVVACDHHVSFEPISFVATGLSFHEVADVPSEETMTLENLDRPIHVVKAPVMENIEMTRADPLLTSQGWVVTIVLTETAAEHFNEIAAANYRKKIAMMHEGVLLSAPVLQARSFGNVLQISGDFTVEEVKDLAGALKSMKSE